MDKSNWVLLHREKVQNYELEDGVFEEEFEEVNYLVHPDVTITPEMVTVLQLRGDPKEVFPPGMYVDLR